MAWVWSRVSCVEVAYVSCDASYLAHCLLSMRLALKNYIEGIMGCHQRVATAFCLSFYSGLGNRFESGIEVLVSGLPGVCHLPKKN